MIVAESQNSRRLVGQLDRGLELVQAIASLCLNRQVRSGVLRAFGTLDEAEVCAFDPAAGGWLTARHVTWPTTILHLGGHISERLGAPHLELTCALLGRGPDGAGRDEVVGGRLVQARVHALELVIDCFDDLVLTTDLDEESGLWGWVGATTVKMAARAAAPAARPQAVTRGFEAAATGRVVARGPAPTSTAEPTPAGPTWAEVVAASAGRGPVEGQAADEAEDSLRAGDVIDHPRFGAGEVERIEGAGDYAQVRLRNQRLVRLSLDVVQLVRDGHDDAGRRRFKARVST